MTTKISILPNSFEVHMEYDGYDAYGVIQSFPLISERYVVLNYHEIDFLIQSLEILKVRLEESVGDKKHLLLPLDSTEPGKIMENHYD